MSAAVDGPATVDINTTADVDVAVVGSGPAGLMAAGLAATAGRTVAIFDHMASPARKLLLAGRGGLNLTHSEPVDRFVTRYGRHAPLFAGLLDEFSPQDLRDWAAGLGVDTYIGSSGRVFPVAMKASGLVRAWLRQLDGLGVALRRRHRWLGWTDDGALRFAVPSGAIPPGAIPPGAGSPGEIHVRARATVLGLGGASWPRTGSDGAWTAILARHGVPIAPLRPSNMGVTLAWSEWFRTRHQGQPVKSIGLSFGGQRVAKGEFIVTRTGIEGGAVYALSAGLRDALDDARNDAGGGGPVSLILDLKPDLSDAEVRQRLSHTRGAQSLSTFVRKALRLSDTTWALLREAAPADALRTPATLAPWIKALPLSITGVQPLDRAISTAGGVPFTAVDEHFMLNAMPGVFVAGEMLDWEAPTGGYLLQGTFATALRAARGALAWIDTR
jgi:uncharacterized flavoprotein (TIGR03862 family)